MNQKDVKSVVKSVVKSRGFAAGPERELESSRRDLHPFSKGGGRCESNCGKLWFKILFDCRFLMQLDAISTRTGTLRANYDILQNHASPFPRIIQKIPWLLVQSCLQSLWFDSSVPGAGLRSSICFHCQCEIRWCLASRKPRCWKELITAGICRWKSITIVFKIAATASVCVQETDMNSVVTLSGSLVRYATSCFCRVPTDPPWSLETWWNMKHQCELKKSQSHGAQDLDLRLMNGLRPTCSSSEVRVDLADSVLLQKWKAKGLC